MNLKRLVSLLTVFALLIALPISVGAGAATENEGDFIKIYTIEDLYNVRLDLTANYILMNDIDLTEATAVGGDWDFFGNGWNPIGSDNIYGDSSAFSGIFEGNGKKIIGMRIDVSSVPSGTKDVYAGLFGKVTGTVRNLTLKEVDVYVYNNSYRAYVGAVAGRTVGATIKNCNVSGSSYSYDDIGGLVGTASNTAFERCSNHSEVIYTYTAGGIAGYSYGSTFLYCSNQGDIYAKSDSGGIVGYGSATIDQSFNTGNVTAEGSTSPCAGGIIGYVYENTSISNCYNSGNIHAKITSSGSRSYTYSAGICAYDSSTVNITNCYSSGAVTAEHANSLAYTKVYGIAYKYKSASKITNSYYLSGSSSTGATKLTEAQMKLKSMYVGFDFENIWVIDSNAEYNKPMLRNCPVGDPETCVHSYTSTTVPPTCSNAGYTLYACSLCGHSYRDDPISAEGHDYIPTVIKPTCLEDGYTTHTCSLCGDSYTDSIVTAKGHTPSTDADCTQNSICLVCGETLKTATGHTYLPTIVEPTCSEQGYTLWECDGCGKSYKDSFVRSKGHTADGAPTCTQDSICTSCGTTLEDKLGHTEGEWKTVTNPTYGKKGLEELRCITCAEVIETRVLSALGGTSYFLGDLDGNGEITALDYTIAKRAFMNTWTLNDSAKRAGDIDSDGSISITDYLFVKRLFMGTYTIK